MKNYFPKNYQDSREQFIKSIESIPSQKSLGRWAIPGKVDQDLFVDHAWFPPFETPKTLFVLSSGIHGSETYAGAAVQAMFIEELLPKIDRKNVGLFIVHCMNPFGFKHHQRCTESGVNLNRNFSVTGENYTFKNTASTQMCQKFLERKPVTSLKSSFMQKMKTVEGKVFFDDVSLDELIKATSPGQFESALDWEYGGTKAEPQTQHFIDKLKELMKPFKDVIGFDLHTGLGDANRLHLLTDVPGKTLNPEYFKQLIKPEQDKEFYAFTPPETEGFYEVFGALNSSFGDLCAPGQRVCSLTMEFGTLGHSLEAQLAGLNSFALAHQGQYHGFANEELAQYIIKENFERSRPPSEIWEHSIVEASRGLFKNVLARL